MSLLETIQLEHLPPGYDIHVTLFKNVKNAEFLQKQLLEGNTDFEYALIDAEIIVSRVQALAASYRAINDLLESRLRSRNVHSEIVFSLAINNNIASSFRLIGITPSTTSLLIIKVTPPTPDTPNENTAESIQAHLTSSIEGEQVPFSDEELSKLTDWPRVKKLYKLNAGGGGGGGKKKVVNGSAENELENEKRELEVMILGGMALRGSTN